MHRILFQCLAVNPSEAERLLDRVLVSDLLILCSLQGKNKPCFIRSLKMLLQPCAPCLTVFELHDLLGPHVLHPHPVVFCNAILIV